MSEPRTDYDRRALTEDQRYLAEEIATSMSDRHDETCGVWSEDGDGCDCPLVMAVADGLYASRVVSVEVERGWDSTTCRGERTVHLPFRPMPVEREAATPSVPVCCTASPAALDVERLRKAHAFIGGITPDEWATIDKAREAQEHLDALAAALAQEETRA